MKDFLCINECTTEQLKELLELSSELKNLYKSGGLDMCLKGKVLVTLFEKPSLRTRMSFQVAMTDLGGTTIYVKPEDIGGGFIRVEHFSVGEPCAQKADE